MSTSTRRLGLGRIVRTLLTLCVSSLIVGGVLAPAALAAPDDSANAGVNRFGACLAAQHSGQVLLLIDESRSLGQTDPQAARVTAAKYLAGQLANFGSSTHAQIDVAVSGFSDRYVEHLGWTPLDDKSLGRVDSSLDQLTNQNSGQDTDYWLALDGAQRTMAQKRPADATANGCQMIAWFTDGQLDFTPRADASKPYAPGKSLNSESDRTSMIDTATQSICRSGGLADQVRSSGIITGAIGLTSNDAPASDFDLLRSIATGQPTSKGECGSIREPAPGGFYLASNIDDLLFAFDKLSTPGQDPLTTETGACVVKVCDAAKHRFVLDKSVASVTILAAADNAGLTPILVAPNGVQVRMARDSNKTSADVGGVGINYSFPSERAVSVRMSNPSASAWTGVWALVFVADSDAAAKTRSSIHITGDMRPAWADQKSTTLHSGDKSVPMKFSIQDGSGRAVAPADLPGTASLNASLQTRDGRTIPIATNADKDALGTARPLDLTGVSPGAATLRMTLAITTAAARDSGGTLVPGTRLSPTTVDLPVTVDPPVGYPKVAPRVEFGTVEGAGRASAQLGITGPGCVWLKDSKFVATPDNSGDLKLSSASSSEQSCVKVADGQQGTLDVALDVPSATNGAANGTLTVMVAPTDGSAKALPVQVPFTASLEKPVNTTSFVLTLVIALILGPLIPLLLLYLAKWATARIPKHGLRAEQIRVRVDGAGLIRDDGSQFVPRDGEFTRLVPGLNGPTRRIDLGGVLLRTHVGKSPFGAGFVVATAAGMAGAGGVTGEMFGKTPDAKLPLAVHNTWFLLHDPRGPENVATVVVLAGDDAGRPLIDRLFAEARDATPRVLPRLRESARKNLGETTTGSGPTPPNPFGGPGRGTNGAPGGQGNPFAHNPTGQAPPTHTPTQAPTGNQGANPFGPGNRQSPPNNPFGPRGHNPYPPADPGAGPFQR